MANTVVSRYRDALAAQGLTDPRTDDQVTLDLGNAASQANPGIFDQHPDFGQEYQAVRDANAPSLAGEAGRALKAGTESLGADLVGGAALATGSDYLRGKAKEIDQAASENAPTIPTMEDIAPGSTGLSKVFNKDTARYLAAKVGGAVPSLAEGVGLAAAGGALGSAIEPGVGTAAGVAEGASEAMLGRGIIKSAIRSLLKGAPGETIADNLAAGNFIKDASETGIADAIRAGDKTVIDTVNQQAKNLASRRSGLLTNSANMYGLSAGGAYNESGDRGDAAVIGAVGALPALVLPEIVIHKLYPDVSLAVGKRLGSQYVTRLATQAVQDAGLMGSTMAIQEAANIAAKNLAAGRNATDFTDSDWKRIRESAIGGAAAGPLAAPLTAMENRAAFEGGKKKALPVTPVAPAEVTPDVPVSEAPAAAQSIPVKVTMMSPEERTARLAELSATPADSPEAQQELDLLRQMAPAPSETPSAAAETAAPVVPGDLTTETPPAAAEQLPPTLPEGGTNAITQVPSPAVAATGEAPVTPETAPLTGEAPASTDKPTYQYTIFPDDMRQANGQRVVQIDEIVNGESQRSTNLEDLAKEGVNLPVPPDNIPVGKYTPEQIQAAIGGGPEAAAASAEPQQLHPVTQTPTDLPAPTPEKLPVPPQEDALAPDKPVEAVPVGDAPVVAEPEFKFGPVVNTNNATADFRVDPRLESLSPQDWADNLPVRNAGNGDRSKTRVALALEAPDGHVVVSGLLVPQELLGVSGDKERGPALQQMASQSRSYNEDRTVAEYSKTVESGGNHPALVQDVVAAGYKPVAYITFDKDAGKIFQRFGSVDEFDKAFGKATGVEITADSKQAAILHTQIDELADKLQEAKGMERAPIQAQIKGLYRQLSQVESKAQDANTFPIDPTKYRQEEDRSLPRQALADRTADFQKVVARLVQGGGRVDLFAKEILRQQTLNPLASGVAYSPWHISVGLEDVQHANTTNLVTLLHEAGHMVFGRASPDLQAKLTRAIDAAYDDIRTRGQNAADENGVRMATPSNPEELLVESLAQRLVAEGIPDAPNLAQSIVRWIKDLYYRVAMATQAAFGIEPSDTMALNWFENQMRRQVGGDYDYRLASIFGKFYPEQTVDKARRFQEVGGTPGGVVDFYDSNSGKLMQPKVEPTDREAIKWNMRFRDEAVDEAMGKELDIPGDEARARIMAAGIAEELRYAKDAWADAGSPGKFEQFWSTAAKGELPQLRLADLENIAKGASEATIGGDRMTDPMNKQAGVQALSALKGIDNLQRQRMARAEEQSQKAERVLVDRAKEINKLEADFRNGAMHEDMLSEGLKTMVRDFVSSVKRGYDTSFAAGELADAVRHAERLTDGDEIPERYQQVFKRILDGEVPIFDYVDSIAKLDMPLHEMTGGEIRNYIRDVAEKEPTLAKLVENKPLFVALSELVRKNAREVDLIQLRSIKDTERFAAIKGELDKIRSANADQLDAMMSVVNAKVKARGLTDRLKTAYLESRADLQQAEQTIKNNAVRTELLQKANNFVKTRIDELNANGVGSYSEWNPVDGAKWKAMSQTPGGKWASSDRTLKFLPTGAAENADQIKRELFTNFQYLSENKAKTGQKFYEEIKRQTHELALIDVQKEYHGYWRNALERMVEPTGQAWAAQGGAGARIRQMLNQFQFIIKSNWKSQIEPLALHWTKALGDVEKLTGIRDHQEFFRQIYDPVAYYLGTEPGRDEAAALREAVRAARRRLPTEPADGFDDSFKNFLRRTKDINEKFLSIAEQHGSLVKDPRLGGELRKAVGQGWLTVMRRMRTGVVQTIVTDMEKAGWKLEFKDSETGDKTKRVVGSTTFDALLPEKADPNKPGDKDARVKVLSDPMALHKAIDPFFTPNIVSTWLEPFLRKPGEPIFEFRGEKIPQVEVQRAWEGSAGDIVAFMDLLSNNVKLTMDQKLGIDPKVEFRASILKQMDDLFVMEARMAYESKQVRSLFDPMGPKPHAIMDARLNDMIPPEHMEHMVFDPANARTLLGTIAFHGAFGRNGERMEQTIQELKGSLNSRKAAWDTIKAQSNTTAARKRAAEALGHDYNELKRAAQSYHEVNKLEGETRGIFGFDNQAGALGDMKVGLEALHAMVGQIVNNPKTGLLNLLSQTATPLVQRSLGTGSLKQVGHSFGELGKGIFGSLLEDFSMNLMRASEHAADIGAIEGQGFAKQEWSVVLSDIGKQGKFQDSFSDKNLIRPLRKFESLTRKGVSPGDLVGLSNPKEFGKMNFFTSPGHFLSTQSAVANGVANVSAFESLVKKGIDFFNRNPEKANDPAYRVTAKDLGMNKGWWFSNEGQFDYYRNKATEYRVGNLEDIIRQATDRQANGQQLLSKQQAAGIAMMAANELNLEASLNTRIAGWQSNPVLKFGLPLLGWPLAQMNQVHQALRTVEGKASAKAALKGLGIMAAWSLPVGLAFTMMTDQYDEKLLKNKSNLRGVDSIAAIPGVGPALALAGAGDRSPMDNLWGMVERLGRAGNIYGPIADAVAQIVSPLDPNSGQKSFSLDSRVLMMSQLLNIQQAMSNLFNQGGIATWSSVERPLLQALGGNGVLHATDLINNALGLDNDESRMVARMNAQKWLRSAGREANVELRKGGGSVNPTPVSVWVREMQYAAYGNNRVDFLDAYRKAIDAARDSGEPDPDKKVVAEWKSRNPLDVFRLKPTDFEMAKIYGTMDESGQQAVREAINSYNNFSTLIEPSKVDQQINRLTRMPSIPGVQNSGSARQRLSQAMFAR